MFLYLLLFKLIECASIHQTNTISNISNCGGNALYYYYYYYCCLLLFILLITAITTIITITLYCCYCQLLLLLLLCIIMSCVTALELELDELAKSSAGRDGIVICSFYVLCCLVLLFYVIFRASFRVSLAGRDGRMEGQDLCDHFTVLSICYSFNYSV